MIDNSSRINSNVILYIRSQLSPNLWTAQVPLEKLLTKNQFAYLFDSFPDKVSNSYLSQKSFCLEEHLAIPKRNPPALQNYCSRKRVNDITIKQKQVGSHECMYVNMQLHLEYCQLCDSTRVSSRFAYVSL